MRLVKVFRWLIGVLWILTACAPGAYPYVRLNTEGDNAVVAPERAPGRLPLRVAVAPVLSPRVTFETYSPLLDYLAHRLDRPVELLQRPTYAEINDLIRTGQADVGFVCGGAFVEGEREGYMELLVVPQINGTTTYQALIIVRADSSFHRLEDLRGRRFAFTDPLSNSGRLYVQYRLAQMGETPEGFFRDTFFTYSHDNSIRAVAQGLADGASVDSLVYESLSHSEPALIANLRVIERSPPFGIPPVVVHPELDPKLKEALRQAFLEMPWDPRGQKALAVLGVERFVLPDPAAYEDIRRMAARVRGWP
ncbi:phosphate/phosphite/phosphonate ABC transporter substrate-binding protein [Thermoflexus sp.]|uniref:substrate-binding domain-containing protein n=1 Tax=Thermoflexus sp. TaxID=1969742 RepID=UPI0035E45F7D